MPEENWLEHNQEKIFYRKSGTGFPVVLIHGFAEDGTIWAKQIDFLKNHYNLIIPDLPGSGKSEVSQQLTREDYADILNQILDKEKLSVCIMIGHSMGGYITLAFAEKYPEKLKAFTLFHSTAYADSEEKKASRRKSIEFIKKNGAAAFIKQSSPNLFSEYTKSNYPELVSELISRYDNSNTAALVSYYESMIQRQDRTDVLRNFKKPIQFIIGEDDRSVPLEQSLTQCHLPEISYIHIFESTGHMGMWEETNKANNSLLAFINQVSA